MKDFMKALGELQPATLVLLIFAAVLLLLLLVLIIVTIRVLKSNGDDEEDEEESEESEEESDNSEEEDETTKKINEAVASVEETKAKVEAEKIAKEAEAARKAKEEEDRESAKAKVEEIAESVHKEVAGGTDGTSEEEYEEDSEDDSEEDSEDSEVTGKLNTVRIEEELKKTATEDIQPADKLHEAAKEAAESDDYNADMDSAFIDTPDVPEGKTLDATEEAIVAEAVKSARNTNKNMASALAKVRREDKSAESSTDEVEENEAHEEPKPKKKKKKAAAPVSDIPKPSTGGAKCYWYNKQDVEGLQRKEDMYFKCHYFTDPDDVILDLITEMYDCGYVRTEQLQRVAYGITFKSLGMKEILQSDEKLGFNKDIATKEPTEADKEEVYNKWCGYVDSFFEIAFIEGSEEVKDYIKKKMYEYGHRDVEELMYSPY
ncbi:MAG TPA: hypothetical protein DEO83_05080 [Lachnospiraceae bacterium]|nr:hypothetical protein [Lachnospiraceae bacterium]